VSDPETGTETPGAAELARLVGIARLVPGVAALGREARLELPDERVAEGRAARDAATAAVEGHLVPRLEELDAPAVVVVAGSTGSGKSTVVNSIAGAAVTPVGAKRPTTITPVIVCNSADLEWFTAHRPIGGGGERPAEVAVSPALPAGLAVVDAPDIDSVALANHALADELLVASDLWLWVTTPTRYGDRRPLEYLRSAGRFGRPLAVLINKLDPAQGHEVAALLAQQLREIGLEEVPMFEVRRGLTDDAAIHEEEIEPVRAWIAAAADPERKRAAIAQAIEADLRAVIHSLGTLGDGLAAEGELRGRLLDGVDGRYAAARGRVRVALEDGSLMHGEVAKQLPEALGTGRYMRQLERMVDDVRDAAMSQLSEPTQEAVRGGVSRSRRFLGSLFDFSGGEREPGASPAAPVKTVTRMGDAAAQSLAEVLTAQAGQAAAESVADWRADPAAAPALADGGAAALAHASPDLRSRVDHELEAWRDDLVVLVRELGEPRLKTARVLSGSINIVAAALMLVVFAGTGGALVGGEVVLAGSAAAVMHRLLVYALGRHTLQDLARRARTMLDERLDGLFAIERARFADALAPHVSEPELAGRVAGLREELQQVAR
jgi:energy-coupling factor transporter ATP-binding protein EcfA2